MRPSRQCEGTEKERLLSQPRVLLEAGAFCLRNIV